LLARAAGATLMLMASISVTDLLVGNAVWSQSNGMSLAIRHTRCGWTAALLDTEGGAVVKAENDRLDDALAELYTAAQTEHGLPG